MKERELYDYLRALPEETRADHTTLLASFLPKFLGILGYDGATIFFEFLLSLSKRLQVDAMVGEDRSAELTWMYVEVKTFLAMSYDPKLTWERVRGSYLPFLTSSDQRLLLFSPRFLGVASKSQDCWYDLTQLTEGEASEIYWLLRRPANFSDRPTRQPDDIGTGAPV